MTFPQYLHTFFEIVGTLYAVASLIGNFAPNTKVGQFCRKFAADLKQVKQLEDKTEKKDAPN